MTTPRRGDEISQEVWHAALQARDSKIAEGFVNKVPVVQLTREFRLSKASIYSRSRRILGPRCEGKTKITDAEVQEVISLCTTQGKGVNEACAIVGRDRKWMRPRLRALGYYGRRGRGQKGLVKHDN